jgi:hypothetical protein
MYEFFEDHRDYESAPWYFLNGRTVPTPKSEEPEENK